MIIEYIRYQIDAARAEAFVAAYRDAAAGLEASPYCLGYDLTRCDEDPTQFTLRIHWTSAEEHMQGFRGSDAFRRFFPPIQPYLNDILEMRHYTPTGLAWTR